MGREGGLVGWYLWVEEYVLAYVVGGGIGNSIDNAARRSL